MKYKCERCGSVDHYLSKSIYDESNICSFCVKRERTHKSFKEANKQRRIAQITGQELKIKLPKELL